MCICVRIRFYLLILLPLRNAWKLNSDSGRFHTHYQRFNAIKDLYHNGVIMRNLTLDVLFLIGKSYTYLLCDAVIILAWVNNT